MFSTDKYVLNLVNIDILMHFLFVLLIFVDAVKPEEVQTNWCKLGEGH